MKILKFIIIFTGFYLLIVISMNFSNLGKTYAQLGVGIKGKVVSPEGETIPGVQVELTSVDSSYRRTTITDANGVFCFYNLQVGRYNLKLELEGFKTVVKENIVLSSGSTTELTITMDMTINEDLDIPEPDPDPIPSAPSTGSIKGKVIDQDGNEIPGVYVVLTSAHYGRKRTYTYLNGVFCFENLPAGRYRLKLELEGFKTVVQKNIYISSGSTKELSTITMDFDIIVLGNNQGINPYKKKVVHKNDSNFYYMEKKLFASYGVAKVVTTKKDLKDINITEVPYKPENYHTSGLDIIPRGVYVIKLDQRGRKLLYIRVLEILKGKIEVEYHLPE
jgi:hypothetical protein